MKRFYTTIGYGCNQNCLNCIIDEDVRNDRSKLDFERFKEVMSTYNISSNDIFEITGGETTFDRELFLRVLKHARKLGFKRERINVLTNAVNLSSKDFVEECSPYFGHVVSTFYSHDPVIHDNIAGASNSFAKKHKALQLMAQNDITLHVKTLISRFNYTTLDKFIDFCASEFPDSYILLTWLDYRADAFKNRAKLLVTLEQAVPYIERALDNARDKDLRHSLLFPFCMIDPFYWEKIIPRDLTTDLEKVIFIDPLDDNYYREYPGKEIRFIDKPDECSGCIFPEKCIWEWKNYKQLQSLKSIKPVVLDNTK